MGEKEAEQLVNFVKLEARCYKQHEYLSLDIKSLKDDLHQNFPTREDLVREISQSKVDMIK